MLYFFFFFFLNQINKINVKINTFHQSFWMRVASSDRDTEMLTIYYIFKEKQQQASKQTSANVRVLLLVKTTVVVVVVCRCCRKIEKIIKNVKCESA